MTLEFDQKRYFDAFIRTAQYLAALLPKADLWLELGEVMTSFFGADIVAFGEIRQKKEVIIRHCTSPDEEVCKQIFSDARETVLEVLQTGFLASEVSPLAELSMAFLPIKRENRPFAVMIVAHRTTEPIPTDLLNVYLAVAGLARTTLEKLATEEAFRVSSAYNRSLIEASLDPLVTIASDGRILDVNAATELITGYSRKQLIGADFSNYFNEPEKARAGYQQAFREGSVRDCALEIRHRDGRLTPVLYNASVYRDEGGKVIGVFVAARDITAQKQAMEQLREQQKAFMEVSVPVITIWRRILMVPLIGIINSNRAQLLMETLLTAIESQQAKVAILDVSGIPVMDTFVAKHLIRIVSASQLMGAECIITGISAAISQSIVHLGVDLSGILTRKTLDEGLRLAFDLTKMGIITQ